ncbi:hypothetical protein M406DRAFT_271856 [Cryphonectria parasitica EP155]|uniref:Uncharacterized protein n=1 Tax=Cryphonectria parasitica (strain ATCC 38755 / EP155) TaxID=660469 RepID=A0A9P5CTQ6_CRYP1|nr:uncharacterized protein M406DRAFT_271856 [Cryphonectria parasitica EP155]KAF3770598.1 hypothetical protein M406DRAFT_271856 [Cryphonectria parasitica EP155]
MAELAAGALVAEQVVSTGLEVGAAASLARSTQPLRATLSQITTSPPSDSLQALARSHHTVTVIGDKAYIFGGEHAGGKLCSADVHVSSIPSATTPTAAYNCYQALPVKDATTGELQVPSPRKNHAACVRGKYLLVHGGSDESGAPIDEDACIWTWDSETLRWAKIHAATQIGKTLTPREGHAIFVDEKQDILVLHGGRTASGQTGETWLYDFDAVAWTQLPSSPAPFAGVSTFVDGTLYGISTDSELGGIIHVLRLGSNATERAKPDALKWDKVDFPTNPLAPGPKSRTGASLLPVSTGYGRHYLLYLLGRKGGQDDGGEQQPLFRPDVWSLQVPSRGFSAAAVKDAIRDKLPGSVESGTYSWAEVEIVPTEQLEHEGKVHPGPRGFFGASPCADGKAVVFWGGLNAKEEQEADGWILRIL